MSMPHPVGSHWSRIRTVALVLLTELLLLGEAGSGGLRRKLEDLFFPPAGKDGRIRRLEFDTTSPDALDRHGLLPHPQVAGLHLRRVHVAHAASNQSDASWRVSSAEVPADLDSTSLNNSNNHSILRNRLLSSFITSSDMQSAQATPLSFRVPREILRSIAYITAASLPPVAYDATAQYELFARAYDTYNTKYLVLCNTSSGSTLPKSGCTNMSNYTNLTWGTRIADLESEAKRLAYSQWTAARTSTEIWTETFLGTRQTACQQTAQDALRTGSKCFGDLGLSLAVYEDATTKVLVFQGVFGVAENQTFTWLYKDWLVEKLEDSLMHEWAVTARESMKLDPESRRGTTEHEMPLRCEFNDATYTPWSDVQSMAESTSVAASTLSSEGFWDLVQALLRKEIPAGSTMGAKQTYFAGTGLGGTHAALAHMWLMKTDAVSYPTYAIAAPGFQCLARSKYSAEIDYFLSYADLSVYNHVMDALSNSVDRHSGRVCLYGIQRFRTSTTPYDFCSKIIGYTGAELFYRNPSTTTTTSEGDAANIESQLAASAEYDANLTNARANFDACHYWTHSIWYALMLFADEAVLKWDGTTDGGCYGPYTADESEFYRPVRADDAYSMCPDSSTTKETCEAFYLPAPTVPFSSTVSILGTACYLVLCFLACGARWMRKVSDIDNAQANLQSMGVLMKCISRILKTLGLGEDGTTDRAREARLRAREARDRKRRVDEKKERHKKKAEKQHRKEMLQRGTEDGANDVAAEAPLRSQFSVRVLGGEEVAPSTLGRAGVNEANGSAAGGGLDENTSSEEPLLRREESLRPLASGTASSHEFHADLSVRTGTSQEEELLRDESFRPIVGRSSVPAQESQAADVDIASQAELTDAVVEPSKSSGRSETQRSKPHEPNELRGESMSERRFTRDSFMPFPKYGRLSEQQSEPNEPNELQGESMSQRRFTRDSFMPFPKYGRRSEQRSEPHEPNELQGESMSERRFTRDSFMPLPKSGHTLHTEGAEDSKEENEALATRKTRSLPRPPSETHRSSLAAVFKPGGSFLSRDTFRPLPKSGSFAVPTEHAEDHTFGATAGESADDHGQPVGEQPMDESESQKRFFPRDSFRPLPRSGTSLIASAEENEERHDSAANSLESIAEMPEATESLEEKIFPDVPFLAHRGSEQLSY